MVLQSYFFESHLFTLGAARASSFGTKFKQKQISRKGVFDDDSESGSVPELSRNPEI